MFVTRIPISSLTRHPLVCHFSAFSCLHQQVSVSIFSIKVLATESVQCNMALGLAGEIAVPIGAIVLLCIAIFLFILAFGRQRSGQTCSRTDTMRHPQSYDLPKPQRSPMLALARAERHAAPCAQSQRQSCSATEGASDAPIAQSSSEDPIKRSEQRMTQLGQTIPHSADLPRDKSSSLSLSLVDSSLPTSKHAKSMELGNATAASGMIAAGVPSQLAADRAAEGTDQGDPRYSAAELRIYMSREDRCHRDEELGIRDSLSRRKITSQSSAVPAPDCLPWFERGRPQSAVSGRPYGKGFHWGSAERNRSERHNGSSNAGMPLLTSPRAISYPDPIRGCRETLYI